VQAPIAETLKTVGRVQVYINFATGSDRIELSSAAVLGAADDASQRAGAAHRARRPYRQPGQCAL
jgi:hypothetical protein